MGMSAIRWEQDVVDGVLVDVWGGWMGRLNVCELRKFREGVWCLRRYNAYPGSGDRDNWCTNFESFDFAKRTAEEWVHAWLELYGLQSVESAKASVEAERTRCLEIVWDESPANGHGWHSDAMFDKCADISNRIASGEAA